MQPEKANWVKSGERMYFAKFKGCFLTAYSKNSGRKRVWFMKVGGLRYRMPAKTLRAAKAQLEATAIQLDEKRRNMA